MPAAGPSSTGSSSYDICCRITRALGIEQLFYENSRSTHAIGGTFGAAAAGASILGLSEDKARAALSYAAQQASGITSWQRDAEHVEKTFDFAGMPARRRGDRGALPRTRG